MATSIDIPKQVERLDKLINQLHLEGCLPESEHQELEQLLLADPAARDWYCMKQELHTMLAVDNSIRLELANDLLPERNPIKRAAQEPKRSRLEEVNQSQRRNAKPHYYRMATSVVAMIAGVIGLIWLLSLSEKMTQQGSSNPAPANEGLISYANQIHPILVDHCLSCHGVDSKNPDTQLRLDIKAATTTGDQPVIVPGDPQNSELIARIQSKEIDYQMPPREEANPLNPEQVELMINWVKQGASYH